MRTFLRLALVLPVLAFAGVASASSSTPSASSAEELSLEELLKRYKAEREKVFESYRGRINALVADIEGAYDGGKKKHLAGFRASLVELGPSASPLLVGLLDAGVNGTEAQKGRARQIALVLSEVSTRAITTELLTLLETGSAEGKRNALSVLAQSDDPERVGPVLRDHFAKAEDKAKGRLLSAIATLGGPDNEAFLGEVLSDKDPQVVQLAIQALTNSRTASAAPRILALVKATMAAGPHAKQIYGYYRACPEVVDEDHCDAILGLVESLTSRPDDAVLLLAILTDAHDEWDSKLKRRLKDLSGASTPRIAQACLIALARNGDRSAKKKLLEPLDERIKDNDSLASTWGARAKLRYQIGDYKNAIKDYTEALRIGQDFGRLQPDYYIGLARCYTLLGKLKDAAKWLQDAPISIAALRALAEDPDFAELVASDRYRDVFHLEDN